VGVYQETNLTSMKKYVLIFSGLILSATSYSLLAQPVSEWQLPRVEIPLVQNDKTVASLKIRFISKSATISYEGEEYFLKLKKDKSVCLITSSQTQRTVATISNLGRKKIDVTSAEGISFVIDRTGKKKQRQYFKDGVPFLSMIDDEVIVGKQQLDTLELLAQAALVFRLLYMQYEAEKSSNTVYYPIVTSAAVDK